MSALPEAGARALAQARVCWRQSSQDLKNARKKRRGLAHRQSAHLSLQAALNALSAVCLLQGHFQLPSSSAVGLLALCVPADGRFEALHPVCGELEAAGQADLFAPPAESGADEALAAACLAHAATVVEAVRGYLRDNRTRFFAP